MGFKGVKIIKVCFRDVKVTEVVSRIKMVENLPGVSSPSFLNENMYLDIFTYFSTKTCEYSLEEHH